MITMAIFILKIDAMAKATGLRCSELFESREDAMASLRECAERFIARYPMEFNRADTDTSISLMGNPGYFTGEVTEAEVIPKGGKVIAESGTVMRCNENNDVYAMLSSTITSISTGMTLQHVINIREKRRVSHSEFDANLTWTGVGGDEAKNFHNVLDGIMDTELKV